MSKAKHLSTAAIIAALYVVLTFISNSFGLASGAIQVRLSESLCILPIFTPAAIPGLFLGCLISNVLCGCVVWDVIFGSIATLIGALFTYLLKNHPKISTIPPILSNIIIIPFVLKLAYGFPQGIWYFVITIGIGEIISCGVLGTLLYRYIKKYNKIIKFL